MNLQTLLQAALWTLILQFLLLPTAEFQSERRSDGSGLHSIFESNGIIQAQRDRSYPLFQPLWTLITKHP